VVALDPALIALRRGLRGASSFALTVWLAQGVSALTGQALTSMALGFSVSIFGAVGAREPQQRARSISTGLLIVAAGLSFCASAAITIAWLNHALFVALVFLVVYARRWGDRASAIGFGAFSSFFLAAFLAPAPAVLPWHLLGLLLATLAIFTVQLMLLPQRPCASVGRARWAIAWQLARVRAQLSCAPSAGKRQRGSLRRELERLEAIVRRARVQLDAVTVGSQLRDELGFAFLRLEAAAENLSRRALAEMTSGDARRGALGPALTEVEVMLRALGDVSAAEPLGQLPEEPPERGAARGAEAQATAAPGAPTISLHTRLAIQATAACALAMAAGQWLSPQRWYWAVITVFVMFTGTASRGDAIYKSLQRLGGTVLGVFAGMGLVSLVGHDPRALFLLLLGAIFLTYHSFTERFAAMTFFLTVMLALLFALLGRFSEQLLWLRLEETAVGAVAGMIVAAVLVPRPTHSHARDRFGALVVAAEAMVAAIIDSLVEHRSAPLGALSRGFVRAQDDMVAALGPLRLWLGQGTASYADVLAELRRCRASLRVLLAAAAPKARPLAPGARGGIERLRADARRQWSELRALARREDAPPSTPRQRGATTAAADPQLEDMTRALDALGDALWHVGTRIDDVSPPAHRAAAAAR
jgi:uncharacterized membrane protein YccC